MPDDASTIKSIVVVLRDHPQGYKILVSGDFNANLMKLEVAERD